MPNKDYSLFGAATTTFSNRFRDASYTRRVPFNQEVFVDSSRDESLVVEVNELNDKVPDENSAECFLRELSKKLYAEAPMDIKPGGIQNCVLKNRIDNVFITTAVGTVDISKRRQGNEVKNLIKVYLANIRLKDPRYKTDILITAYEPVFLNPQADYKESGGSQAGYKQSGGLAGFIQYGGSQAGYKQSGSSQAGNRQSGPPSGEMEQVFKDAVSNFKVNDWSFFTEDD